MEIRFLQRVSDREGIRLCAMTAVSLKLGYQRLTDTPKEVDPGLAAFVNLLNDRANDYARQLLIPRLDYLPNTGRTDLAHVIATVFLPAAMERYGYAGEAETIRGLDDEDLSDGFRTLASRFVKPDGLYKFASGCAPMSVALEKDRDPTTTDLLAVCAAGEVIFFETGEHWFEALQILDFVLGIQDSPHAEQPWLSLNHGVFFRGYDPFEDIEMGTAH